MNKTLQLVFLNLAGNRVSLNIPDPLDELDPQAVEQAMDQILAADVVITSGGGLVSKVRAVVVSRDEDAIIEF
ncbi:MAG: DUF2922 domain-containing protein [Bacillota bacterium]